MTENLKNFLQKVEETENGWAQKRSAPYARREPALLARSARRKPSASAELTGDVSLKSPRADPFFLILKDPHEAKSPSLFHSRRTPVGRRYSRFFKYFSKILKKKKSNLKEKEEKRRAIIVHCGSGCSGSCGSGFGGHAWFTVFIQENGLGFRVCNVHNSTRYVEKQNPQELDRKQEASANPEADGPTSNMSQRRRKRILLPHACAGRLEFCVRIREQ